MTRFVATGALLAALAAPTLAAPAQAAPAQAGTHTVAASSNAFGPDGPYRTRGPIRELCRLFPWSCVKPT